MVDCPQCGKSMFLGYTDDAATKWYRCSACGIDKPIPATSEEKARLIQQAKEMRHRHEDKPKIRNRCGGCAAFHTPFCSWEYKDYDAETMQALAVDAEAYACTRYFPRPHVETEGEKKFLKKVEQLE